MGLFGERHAAIRHIDVFCENIDVPIPNLTLLRLRPPFLLLLRAAGVTQLGIGDMFIGLVDDDDSFCTDVARWASALPSRQRPQITRCASKAECLSLIRDLTKAPKSAAILLLDLNIDGQRDAGLEILRKLRNSKKRYLRQMPVVIYSNSDNPKEIDRCYLSSANSYVWKGFGAEQKRRFEALVRHWQKIATLPAKKAA